MGCGCVGETLATVTALAFDTAVLGVVYSSPLVTSLTELVVLVEEAGALVGAELADVLGVDALLGVATRELNWGAGLLTTPLATSDSGLTACTAMAGDLLAGARGSLVVMVVAVVKRQPLVRASPSAWNLNDMVCSSRSWSH